MRNLVATETFRIFLLQPMAVPHLDCIRPTRRQQRKEPVEVKSPAYVQSWFQKAHSKITFSGKKSLAWDRESNRQSTEAKRQADVYVFAVLAHQDKTTVNPLNLDQWEFWVLPTKALDERKRSQHSITLKSLRMLCGDCWAFGSLQQAVMTAGKIQRGELGM